MQISKEQYLKIRKLTQELDSLMDEIRGTEASDDEDRNYWNNRLGILAEVMLAGGVVSVKDWARIGKEHGYDVRGLGGYFVGKDSSMVSIADDRRAITESGKQEIKSWLNGRFRIKPWDAQLKKYQSIM